MLMANYGGVVLSCVVCVVQHVSWFVGVQVIGEPRRSTTMEKVRCRVRARWTGSSEGWARRLGPMA
jgi:hypothetical protein